MADDSIAFIKLARKVFDSENWLEPRTFSKFEAWLDMIKEARWGKESRSVWVNERIIKVYRGEILMSHRFMSQRWGWSEGKVNRWIKLLKTEGQIEALTRAGVTVLKLSNYETYNTPHSGDGGTDGGSDKGSDGGTDGGKTEEGKKGKKVKNSKGEKKPKAKKPQNEWEGLPDLLNNEMFKAKWGDYERYRVLRKISKLLHTSKVHNWNRMTKWGMADSIESIDQTIRSQWQGLFKPKKEAGSQIETSHDEMYNEKSEYGI